jgi:hypothetical protein
MDEGAGADRLSGIDTRALTRRIRMTGAPNAVIAHDPAGKFDLKALHEKARGWPGLVGMDLAKDVTGAAREWTGGVWTLGQGYIRHPSGSWGLRRWSTTRRKIPAFAGMTSAPPHRKQAPRRRAGFRREGQHLPQPRAGRRAGDGGAGAMRAMTTCWR